MKKTLIYIVLLVVIIIIAVAAFRGDDDGDGVTAMEARGTITAIDLDQAMADGPYVVTIMTDAGERDIEIPSMGILLCEAKDKIASMGDLSVGQTVEVKGNLTSDGAIVPCDSPSHYLRVTGTAR